MQGTHQKLPRWLLLATIAFGVIILLAIVILKKGTPAPLSYEEQEFQNNAHDITETPETLSDSLISAIQHNPYKDYQTSSSETKFSNLTARELCSRANLTCSDLFLQHFTEVPAINPNALDYYLDNSLVVFIITKTSTTIIYGALRDIPNYLIISSTQKDFDGYNYLSASELFDPLTGTESFYTLKVN